MNANMHSKNLLPALIAGALIGCAPSIKPALKAKVDGEIAGSMKSTAYEAPASLMPPPLEVGQWVKHVLVHKNGNPSISTYKVVGKVGSAFWVEFTHESYSLTQADKLLVDFDFEDMSKTRIIRAITKTGDSEPQEVEGQVLKLAQSMYKKMIQSMTLKWVVTGRKDKRVPAGNFSQCYQTDSKVEFGFFASSANGLYHSSVPINGLVFSESEDYRMELLDFGMTGAIASY